MKINLKCLFRHKWVLSETFSGMDRTYRKTTWEGHQCTTCQKRVLTKTKNYDYYNDSDSDKNACDWLNAIPVPPNPVIKIKTRVED